MTCTNLDRELSSSFSAINLDGEKATWNNEWEAAGTPVSWNMIHYDVQLIGGMVLNEGSISEMGTGEGKTLVATLPAYLNAISGKRVHIVTVNDYLASRDAEWMGKVFSFLGLSVGTSVSGMSGAEKQKA